MFTKLQSKVDQALSLLVKGLPRETMVNACTASYSATKSCRIQSDSVILVFDVISSATKYYAQSKPHASAAAGCRWSNSEGLERRRQGYRLTRLH